LVADLCLSFFRVRGRLFSRILVDNLKNSEKCGRQKDENKLRTFNFGTFSFCQSEAFKFKKIKGAGEGRLKNLISTYFKS
jgi:hypothetical protein